MKKQYVSFKISETKYCVNIMDVQEVVREEQFTPMPDVPDFVEGIMNLRGVVIPVISVRKKMGIFVEPEEFDKKKTNKLIIANIENLLVGFLVDALDRVFSIEEEQIQSSEGVSSRIDQEITEGVAKVDNEVYIILNVKKMLDMEVEQFLKQEIVEEGA